MRAAAKYDRQWEGCRSVEEKNALFSQVIRSYSELEDQLRIAEVIIGDMAAKVAAYKKRK